MPDVIIISSDEEDENAFTKVKSKKKPDKRDVVDLTVSPDSTFSLSRSKLNALKRSRQRSKTNKSNDNKIVENHNPPILPSRELIVPTKSSPSKYKFDPVKLKHLRAVVKLEKSPSTIKTVKIERDVMDDNMDVLPEGILSSPKYEVMETVSQSPSKRFPAQKNLLQYLKSSPKRNNLEDDFEMMKLSPSTTPRTTPKKSQTTLEHFVSPTKRMKVKPEVPGTPSCDINAKRNELVWPPKHLVLDTEEFIKTLYKNPRDFPTAYANLLESLQDEELHVSVVKSINTFMSRYCAPSPEMIQYLVNDILLSNSSSPWLMCLTYAVLNDILERYPAKCIGLKISWEDLKKHFVQDFTSDDKKSRKKKPCSELVLSFLLSVMSVELKASALKSQQRRLAKHFSADFHARHVKDIIPCLKECLENHTASPSVCCNKEGRDFPSRTDCGLEQLQTLLKLFIIVSLNKRDAEVRLADELLYLYIELPCLEQRVLLIQSVKSHHVRAHLINVLLMNYCALLPEALPDSNLPLCVRKIFKQDFYREPPKRSEGHAGYLSEDVEEYVTLLAYILQSYVVTHTSSLHGYHNDHSLCHHNDVKEFSQEDLISLQELHNEVSRLRKRCKDFLNGESLSIRTKLLLYLMGDIV